MRAYGVGGFGLGGLGFAALGIICEGDTGLYLVGEGDLYLGSCMSGTSSSSSVSASLI